MKNLLIILITTSITFVCHAQQLEWAKSFGGSNDEFPYAITSDNAGNVYATGFFSGVVDFDPGVDVFNIESEGGSDDAFLSVLNSNGELNWVTSFKSSTYSGGSDVVLDESGNIYITGYFSGTIDVDPNEDTVNLYSAGGTDIFLVKLSNDGEFIWGKSFGGTGYDDIKSIEITANEEILLSGHYHGTVDFNLDPSYTFNLTSNGDGDIFILKLESNGDFQWAKSIGGENYDGEASITSDPTGNIFLTGGYQGTIDFDPGPGVDNLTSNGSRDVFILKLSSDGNLIWVKSVGGTGYDRGNSIAVDALENVYVCGYFSNSIDITSGASTLSLNSNGGRDVLIMKYHTSGSFIWAKSFGSASNDWGQTIAIDPLNKVIVTGNFRNSLDLDSGDDSFNITSQGEMDIFLINLNSSGLFEWGTSFGGNNNDQASDLTINHLGNIYTTGTFKETANFDFPPNISNLTSVAYDDVYIQKVSPEYASIDHEEITEFKLYPNPTNGLVNIDLSQFTEEVTITIFDSFGKLVYKELVSQNNSEIAIDLNFPTGVYIVNLSTSSQQLQQKLIKH